MPAPQIMPMAWKAKAPSTRRPREREEIDSEITMCAVG